MVQRNPRGRPASPPGERLSTTIGIRLTPDEAARLLALTARHNTSASVVLRRFIRRVLERHDTDSTIRYTESRPDEESLS